VHRVLALPLPEADLDAMEAEAAPFHPGYEILTFHDDLPESLVPSYCFLVNQLAVDAPTGDVDFEAEQMTPEIYHAKQERRRRQGRHRLTSLAVRHGEAVGVTDLIVPPEDRPKVYQGVTLVRRDHRGRHLGAAVKVANLRAVQQRYPERSEIHTTNEETNATMIGINERLGFRRLELCPELLLRL
jgi:RimJ/RimL family protein N-acetyltransferase